MSYKTILLKFKFISKIEFSNDKTYLHFVPEQMLDVLLENVEAFLEHELSISRIQIGEIAMFADKLGLDETKEALQDIVHIVKVNQISFESVNKFHIKHL